jgi:hypothetical protein
VEVIMGGNPLWVIGLVAFLGFALNIMRFMNFLSGGGNNSRAKASRITDMDAHLSFDERIAERMRELEREKHSGNASTSAPPTGFGRRGV